jgi:hypothetical protein
MGELAFPPKDCSVCERNNAALAKALAAGYGIDESANVHKQGNSNDYCLVGQDEPRCPRYTD